MSLRLKNTLRANKRIACYSKMLLSVSADADAVTGKAVGHKKTAPDAENRLPDNPHAWHAKANFLHLC